MAKSVRWQVPFVSRMGTAYRIDIYDEGAYTPTQLLAGETPFVTEEDQSDDFFSPVRTQSGTIQICTQLLDGTILDIASIMPANNIQCPVRLISIENNVETIEWQGFLSCESYSQDYIGVPQTLDLAVISVLEGMDSIRLAQDMTTMVSISSLIYEIISQLNQSASIEMFTDIYYSRSSWRVLLENVNKQWFYDESEMPESDSMTYFSEGKTLKSILESFCIFMGWVVRENKTGIYFERICEELGMFQETLSNFGTNVHTVYNTLDLVSEDLSTMNWCGSGHQRSITQGAKRVSVSASGTDGANISLGLPGFPFSDTTSMFGRSILKPYNNVLVTQYPRMIAEKNIAYYPTCTHSFYSGTVDTTTTPIQTTLIGESTFTDFLAALYLNNGSITATTRYAGACLINFSISHSQIETVRRNQIGLYCSLLPNLLTSYLNPIFSMRSASSYYISGFNTANLVITGKMLFIGYDKANSRAIMTDHINDEFLNIKYARMAPIVRWGNMYYDGMWKPWTGYDSASGIYTELSDDGFELVIPITSQLSGQIEIGIQPSVSLDSRDENILHEVIFTDLKVEIEQADEVTWRGTNENNYIQVLNTNFRDEIEISSELATDNSNNPLFVLPFSTIEYTKADATTETRRPEQDLVTRLAAYYGSTRTRLQLDVVHPAGTPQLMRLNGINDGKVYVPIAESRDWQKDTSVLTCAETPVL